jgi:molybdopterin adenylyltransferase
MFDDWTAVGGVRAAVLVLSDKGARGERKDESGPALVDFLADRGCSEVYLALQSDDEDEMVATLLHWCDEESHDLILTCGGTGVAPRDNTPEATRRVITRELPGFGESMRAAGLRYTTNAIVSRALAGVRGESLIINLPGSPRGAVQSLEAVWPAVPHLLAKLKGDSGDCAVAGD